MEELKYQNFIDECIEDNITFGNMLIQSKQVFGEIIPLDFFVGYIHKIRLDLESLTDREYYHTKYCQLLDLDNLLLFDYSNKMALRDNALTLCQEFVDDNITDYYQLPTPDNSDTNSDTVNILDATQDNNQFDYSHVLFIASLTLISFICILFLAYKMKDNSVDNSDKKDDDDVLHSAYEEYFNSLSPAKYLILSIIPVLFLHMYQMRYYYYYRILVFYHTILNFPQDYLKYLKYLTTQILQKIKR